MFKKISCGVSVLFLSLVTLSAQTLWTDGTGDWFNAGNWSAGVPSSMIDAEITNGGTAQINAAGAAARRLNLGNAPGESGSVTVTGPLGTLNVSLNLSIGEHGVGTFDISAGAVVTADSLRIGHHTSSTGTATVDGAGSKLSQGMFAAGAVVGDFGMGSLTISNGATFTYAALGVGDNGGHGTVLIESGGTANTASSGAYLGNADDAVGMVTVTGAGSEWTSGLMQVAVAGTGTLNIEDGGKVGSTTGQIANSEGTPGNTGTVNVDGMGSTWTMSENLSVGLGGVGALNITDGGTVSNTAGTIARDAMSSGTVNVAAAGVWTSSEGLKVGEGGLGALHLHSGGMVSNTFGQIGSNADSDGTATIDGLGSTWTNNGTFLVGASGTGLMEITNGGAVTSGVSLIGANPGGNGTADVSGMGSTWTASSLYIGGDPMGAQGTGLLRVQTGGTINGPITVWDTGTLEVGLNPIIAGPLTFDGGTLRTIANMTFSNNASLAAGGVVFDSNGFSSTFSGGYAGPGGITKINAGAITMSGPSVFGGTMEIDGGSLLITGSVITPQTNVNAGGLLGGTGTLNGDVLNGGVVSPGLSPGTFTVNGVYTQSSAGTLRIEIAGVTPGNFDLLQAGSAFLDGTLQVVRFNNYSPQPGDSMTILSTAWAALTERSLPRSTAVPSAAWCSPPSFTIRTMCASFSCRARSMSAG